MPTERFPGSARHPVNPPVGWLCALDRQDPDEYDQLLGILERLPSLPVAFDRWETGGV
jgi:hypothetical protein